MSYTVDIVSVPVPESDDQAWQLRDALMDATAEEPGPLPDRVQALYRLLTARFPCIMENPDGPWSDGPLINNFRPEVSTLGISYPRVAEVLPFLIATALDQGFVVFDGQDEAIHRPGRPVSRPPAASLPSKPTKPWWRPW